MEKLALSIQSKVNSGMWRPIHISKGGPGLTHLLFADDILLFCEANPQQAEVVMETLDDFCMASGMKVNVTKSKAMCSKKVSTATKRNIKEVSAIRFVANLGHYLGFPLVQGRVNKDTYSHILEKMHTRLSTWKGNLLNKAGRVCLAKSVTTAMPIYTMQIHYLPQNICDRIDRITKSFIWGGNGANRKWNMVKWSTVTSPKKFSGLAIREARLSNLALLGKLIWQLLHEKHKLWVKVLHHKYINHGSILQMKASGNTSLVWRSISKALEALKQGFQFRIGDGSSSFWFFNWNELGELCHLVDFVNISDTQLKLKDVGIAGSWNWNLMSTMVSNELKHHVNQHPPPIVFNSHPPDMWVWGASITGMYSCSNAYGWLLAKDRDLNVNENWNWVWKLQVPAKVQHFIWLCLHNALPTNQRRHRCNLANSPTCNRCGSSDEDIIHCLRDCRGSREVWQHLTMFDKSMLFNSNNVHSWFKGFTTKGPCPLFAISLWWIWRFRNEHVLGDGRWRASDVVRLIYGMKEDMDVQVLQSTTHHIMRSFVKWEPPPVGVIKLNVDGSCNEVGDIGAGGVLRDSDGKWLAGFSSNDGKGDPLFAELFGVYHGLVLLLNNNIVNVICETDCEEVTHLLQHRDQQCFHAYASLLLRITTLMDTFPSFDIRHVLREGNCPADFMAKLGRHASLGVTNWSEPPGGLKHLLRLDAP